MKKTGKPLMLMILDGWGESSHQENNAIAKAQIPNFRRLKEEYPATTLEASGEVVGLPVGQMGNSEVGHLNMGAGRIVYQELTRIDRAIKTGELFTNPVLIDVMDKVAASNTSLHFMGLLSDGGVHSHISHLYALLDMAKERGVSRILVHAFLDGRDVPPANAQEYITALEERMRRLGVGAIATVMGRFYAMDRDKRWDRVELAYNTMVLGQGLHQANFARGAVEQSYEMRITDEFVEPNIIVDEQGRPRATVRDSDGIIFFNFRADRAREITRAFVDPDFDGFTRRKWPQVHYVCLTQYDIHIKAPVAFPPQNLENTLGEVLAKHGLKQLRIAETEKYAHVTFFFNGGVEEPNPGEDRILIPSPKVATYNLQPEMSALEVTDRVIQEIAAGRYDVIIINYANPDMVGHTGIIEAAVKAVTVVDQCLGRVVAAVLAAGGRVLITADHGNAEEMMDPDTGQPHTAHTLGRVPFIMVDPDRKQSGLRSGALEDIAPTMLQLLGLPQPVEMTGQSLIIGE